MLFATVRGAILVMRLIVLSLLIVLLDSHRPCAATGGSLTGTVTDPSGAVVPGSTVILLDALHIAFPTFVMGAPITNVAETNNTWLLRQHPKRRSGRFMQLAAKFVF